MIPLACPITINSLREKEGGREGEGGLAFYDDGDATD
jgi:hypothetical protein